MRNETIARKWTMLSATVTTTATSLRSLVTIPPDIDLLQISITPGAAIIIVDGVTTVEFGLASGVTKHFPVTDILDVLKVKCASGTVTTIVEVFYNQRTGR